MASRPISFRWDPEFVVQIDAARGDVPRSVFVRRAVEATLAVVGHKVIPIPQEMADALRRSVAQPSGLGKGPVAPRPKGKR